MSNDRSMIPCGGFCEFGSAIANLDSITLNDRSMIPCGGFCEFGSAIAILTFFQIFNYFTYN